MLGGTETGVQNKLHDVPVTQRCIGGHQAALDRFGAHFFQVDAATVVHKTQQHLASLSGQTQNNSSALALALAGALFWRLDAVVDQDRKSTRLNSSHVAISYAVF